jgi:hypothetical protein
MQLKGDFALVLSTPGTANAHLILDRDRGYELRDSRGARQLRINCGRIGKSK